MAKKKKPFKWEVKELDDGRWGLFLCEEHWRYKDEPVMYAAGKTKESVQALADRMNDPSYWAEEDV